MMMSAAGARLAKNHMTFAPAGQKKLFFQSAAAKLVMLKASLLVAMSCP
jgi:hypothetical protein